MWSTARNIAAGDLVIVWLTRESVQPLLITPGKEFNGKFGVYSHADLVGIPYGSKVGSRNGKGFIHVLRPTPELWTLSLPHRTQILYLADIAFITSYLDIKPGSQVIEAGTGSGSFSHSVARTIGSKGHLYSYEFHEARANKAEEEFKNHGLSEIITLTHRNVCKDGFTVIDQVDSVFLDLPAPWEAIVHARKALRKDRATRICCFSPCIEQVLRTVAALNDAGFSDIVMYETLLRPHEVHSVPSLQPIGAVSDKLKQQEAKREYKRLQQIASSQAKKKTQSDKKRKRSTQESEESTKDGTEVEGAHMRSLTDAVDSGSEAKKVRTEEEGSSPSHASPSEGAKVAAPTLSDITKDPQVSVPLSSAERGAADDPIEMAENPVPADDTIVLQEPPPDSHQPIPIEQSKTVISRVINEVRGHTSYLTFAVLLPSELPSETQHALLDLT